ncbi:MAG: tryptophan 2,3-dioxygenase [Deltaproteobacteria bacterium]|nr:tryptophan 2,3-dioxygenase [Deltaproteobacteria bacterium]
MARPPTTYWDYIKVESLLALQSGVDDSETALANDEVMFITVHQIDELWFKLAIRELVVVRDCMAQEPVPEQSLAQVVHGLRRAVLLMQNVAQHFALMESMTTRDYLAFRDKLSPASGFQSAQLREIEFLLGLADEVRVSLGGEGSYLDALRAPGGGESPALRRVLKRREDLPTILTAMQHWLYRTPICGSHPGEPDDGARVQAFLEDYLQAHAKEVDGNLAQAVALATNDNDRERLATRYRKEKDGARMFLFAEDRPLEERERTSRIRAAIVFIESYRELPLLAWPREVVDGIVALEQAFLVFRQRHARMVERVIGRRTGTGGSAGVDYLDQTALRYRVFSDLWAVRTLLVRRDALPKLEDTSFYDFAGGH